MDLHLNFSSKYEISDKYLGKGRFSVVYLGTEKQTKNKVAIKIINLTHANKKMLEYIEQEVIILQIIKQSPHPNVVYCHDIIKKDDHVYIIMEFCENGDLSKYLSRPMKEIYVQFYFAQLSAALKYLASKGIIHRDIKPKNVLLTNKRRVLKLADFGLAKLMDTDMLNTICGSPLYMSPEVIHGKEYNSQTDLWSLGMILFEMLYGFHPYQHCQNVNELLLTIKKNPIVIPPKFNRNKKVSEECISLLKMLLQKNVERRISWGDFFNHPWINKWEYVFATNQLKNKSTNKITFTMDSLAESEDDVKIKNDSDISNFNSNSTLSESLTDDDDDGCIFEMGDINTSGGSYCIIKKKQTMSKSQNAL
jgi:serine/threonine-protein kinase ULK2